MNRASPAAPGVRARAGALLLAAAMAAGVCVPLARAQAVRVVIESPQQEETVHDNAGNVAVSVAIQGDMPARARIRVLLDGLQQGAEQGATSFVIEGVERGEHLLQVELVDEAGRILGSSETVKFFMWQASQLFPSRKR